MKGKNYIKEYRKKRNLKQSELAEKSCVSLRAIQNYEAGIRIPDILTLQKIAIALDVEVNDLYPVDNTA